LKLKNKHALIRKFNLTWNKKKIIITQLLYNIKKVTSIYFLFTAWKKKFNKRNEKKSKEKKKIKNIFKEKILKGKKLVASVLCAIHGATIEILYLKIVMV
jgi:hypothetical protein